MSDNLQDEVQRFTDLSRKRIDNKEELDTYLSLFIAWLKRKDGTLFKVESLHYCYAALARYLKESTAIPGGIRGWDRYNFSKAVRCLNGKIRSL
ncbi:hypothetical protein C2G38_2239224 [Gigaspora rosea]|uniref:Uncharacterized protein n=1 Tax=Gigaspora rosea TaxID=44941 RepID=A0A397W3U9_9GLOM|nr:hypothetical protein C2G38_2239224 [Gigaspora rosea]